MNGSLSDVGKTTARPSLSGRVRDRPSTTGFEAADIFLFTILPSGAEFIK